MLKKAPKNEQVAWTIVYAIVTICFGLLWLYGVFIPPSGEYDFKETVWQCLHPAGVWNIVGFIMINITFFFASGLWARLFGVALVSNSSGIKLFALAFGILGVILLFS